ncbi:MAG: MopE-related protein, partial [Myxococcota bacterium]|nr:MopE-related protein [Myxococcota bacterium]
MPRFLSLFSLLLTLVVLSACDPTSRDDDDDTTGDDTNLEDLDGDGYCPSESCEDDDLEPDDCDDGDNTVFPGNLEACDAKDNNCDGRIDEDFDRDQDGYIDEFGTG